MEATFRIILRTLCFVLLGAVGLHLTSKPLLANGGVVWIVPILGAYGLGILIPIILIEVYVLKRMLEIKTLQAFIAVFYMNALSTFAGFMAFIGLFYIKSPVAVFFLLALPALIFVILHGILNRSYALMKIGIITLIAGASGMSWTNYIMVEGIDLYYSPLIVIFPLSILIYGYGLLLAIEVWPARRYIPLDKLDRIVIWANNVTYVVAFIGVAFSFSLAMMNR